MSERILVTSALPYANGPIHLGHLAGAYLPADIFVRYHRLKGSDIIFICGSDEHGVPIMLKARAEGVDPQKIVDEFHERNKKSFADFGIDFTYYGRTSSPVHHQTSQDFFRTLAQKKQFILKKEEQLFDPEAGIFLADRFVRGTCPSCGYDDAYGDQCEKCGTSLSPAELINPRSAITNAKPVLKETTHWYLPLSRYQKKLEKWIASHPEWKPNTLGQIKSWFSEGLKDRAVTRDLPWGVPIPEDIAKQEGIDASGKVLYVWFDAPIGYISATREWAIKQGNPDLWKEYWQNQNTRLVHFIGKDNIVFHCIIFPAMLAEHGQYVLPDNVPANEFLNLEGNKLSTSRNYAVWLEEYLQKFEPDSLRYTLASNLPETRDTDFSWKDFQARHNNELADILGNFINRTVTFAHRYFEGKVPPLGTLDAFDEELVSVLKKAPALLGGHIDNFRFKLYIKDFMDMARFANKYFNDREPWKTRKSNPSQCATSINLCLQTCFILSVMGAPVIPFTSRKIWKLLNYYKPDFWDYDDFRMLPDSHKLNTPEILFTKIEDGPIATEIERLQKANPVNIPRQEQELIDIETFSKVKLKIAEILKAEKVEKADRLLRLSVRVGDETRQIIAGLAKHYQPENLIGKKVVVVYNLAPAVLRGLKSEGMLLAASDENQLTLLTVMEDIKSGADIR
ncbi:MAG: methionine--tRNA ligase [Calditrichaceae bacterium]|nr:methionine--tRNA ligase [Calditrichaceae bacterium]MBN2710511.1 methionine--tRNA ligase [Calditrichaceae bacterium]RQV97303.1 MAG: methionine--tRNA ligase [Calditrichota bacterium]